MPEDSGWKQLSAGVCKAGWLYQAPFNKDVALESRSNPKFEAFPLIPQPRVYLCKPVMVLDVADDTFSGVMQWKRFSRIHEFAELDSGYSQSRSIAGLTQDLRYHPLTPYECFQFFVL